MKWCHIQERENTCETDVLNIHYKIKYHIQVPHILSYIIEKETKCASMPPYNLKNPVCLQNQT